MSVRKGLTWSSKWHIVDEAKSHDRYDVANCGAYLYNDEKEHRAFRGGHMPEHLQQVINGTKKSKGDCKLCNRSAGRKSVEELLSDEDMAAKVGELIYERSQMARGDADDLAWDVMNLIKEQAS